MTTKKLTLAALFLALGLVLPFITGQIPNIGSMLLPMHFPVILAGIIIDEKIAPIIGFILPLLRYALFGMPPIFPTGIAMAFELMTYALVIALMYKHTKNVILSLITSMIMGRIIWGIVMFIITKISFTAFISAAFISAIPGIILQLILIPIILKLLKY